MEAALRDYSNSFHSLQSASQVRHPIIVLHPPFGEEGGGRERSRPLSHMCSVLPLQLTGYLPRLSGLHRQ